MVRLPVHISISWYIFDYRNGELHLCCLYQIGVYFGLKYVKQVETQPNKE